MLLGVIELVVVGASLRPTLALGIAAKIGNPTIFVVLAGIVASCVLMDPTPRARSITLLAVLTSALALLAALLLTLLSLASRALRADVAGVVVTLVISGLAVAVLVKLFQLQPAPAVSGPAPQHQPEPELAPPPVQPEPPDPQRQPTWQPDTAAGAAWLTARDAAAGAPASGWGTPGEAAGWQPIPAAPTPPPAAPAAAGAADDETTRAAPVDSAGPDQTGEQPAKPARPAPNWWSDQA
jgi:hypothetical protein